jgi:hypothetical protein
VRTYLALTRLNPQIPGQSCSFLQHVTDYLLDIRLRAGIRPARERVETGKGTGGKRLTQAVALMREAVVTQAMKKPGKTRISEEDWSRYIDAVRRETSRGHNEKKRTTAR